MSDATLTRQELLLAGVAGVVATGGAAAAGPFVRAALAQSGRVDAEVVRFALGLERLEATFYERALREVPDMSPGVRRLARELAQDEAEHAEALTQLAGQIAASTKTPTRFDFGEAFASERSFLATARTLEDTGVAAYNGAGPLIEQLDILAAAGSIVQVEARHAALIRWELGEEIAPNAFDAGLDMKAIGIRVAPFVRE